MVPPNEEHILAIDPIPELFRHVVSAIPGSPAEITDHHQVVVGADDGVGAVDDGIGHSVGRFGGDAQIPGWDGSPVDHGKKPLFLTGEKGPLAILDDVGMSEMPIRTKKPHQSCLFEFSLFVVNSFYQDSTDL
jgi:hypothetical protein